MDLIPVPPTCLISLCRSSNSSFINFPAYGTRTYQRWVRQLHGVLTQKSGVVTGHLCERHFSANDFQLLQSGIGDAEGILPMLPRLAPANDPLNESPKCDSKLSTGVVIIKDEPLDEDEEGGKPELDAFTAFREALARVYPNKQPPTAGAGTEECTGNNGLDFEEKYKPQPDKSLKEIFKKFDNVKKMKSQHEQGEKITVKVEPDVYPLNKKQKAAVKKHGSQKKSLKAYRHTEVKANSYQCHQCQRPFQQKAALAKHIASNCDAGLRDFVCPMCGSNFPTKLEFARHMASHSDEMQALQCDKCPLVFPTQDDLDRHTKTHIRVGEKKKRKSKGKAGAPKPKPVPYSSRIKNPQTVFPCRRCDAKFSNRKDRREHTKTHKQPFECHHCAATFELKVRLLTHLATHFVSLRQFVCPQCGWGFTARYLLNNHLFRHANERNFICEICSSAFKSQSDLRLHKRTHLTTNLYTCHHCGQMYQKRCSLLQHMVEHFSSLRKFMCTTCGKRFTSNFRLLGHMERHKETREFQCTVCPKAFKGLRDLKVHAIRHYQTEKMHKCFVCNKSYTRASGLKRHESQIGHQKLLAELVAYQSGVKADMISLERQNV